LTNDFKIKNIIIPSRLILAPMAGVSSSSFRWLCLKMGAGLVCSEMISDKGILYKNKNTTDLLFSQEEEHPLSIQVFGATKETLVEAAKYVDKNTACDIIDINMGCPVPKVALRSQAGSALLKDPAKIFEIVSSVVASVSKPVSVKIRSGWDDKHINCVEVARLIEQAGASAIIIHPRTRALGYSGHSDWSLIKQIKEAVSIPVIGNGDVIDEQSAKAMFDSTNCDAIMIGRASMGNPFIFKQINHYLTTGNILAKPTLDEVKEAFLEHLNGLIKQYGQKNAVSIFRGLGPSYFKGYNNASKTRSLLSQAKTLSDIQAIINEVGN
jgi:nifR3 family TIM-barrel protein